jgi:hypothetical protein
MALLGREGILNANDMKTEDVPVPEWGGEVRIRTLTGTERDEFEASMVEMKKDGSAKRNVENVRARLLILCIINERGEQMFNRADIKLLGRKSAAALDRVANACNKLNAFSEEDIEELAENFDSAPSEDSTSD